MELYLDATTIKDSTCLRKVCLRVINGYSDSVDFKAEYGTGFHKFIKNYCLTGNLEESILIGLQHYTNPKIFIPENEWRNPGHLLKTCNDYAAYWGNDGFAIAINRNGKPVVEERFCVPIYRDAAADITINLFGMIDRLGQEVGIPIIMDHKVTSDAHIDSYLAGYLLSPQMLTYDYAMRKLAGMYPDTFGQFSNPAFVIDGIFISRSKATQFARSNPFKFSETQRLYYSIFLNRLCVEIAEAAKDVHDTKTIQRYQPTGIFNGACDGKYFRRCCFSDVCIEPDTTLAQMKLEANFESRPSGPWIFDEETPAVDK